ncbi:type II toxin-antitoxin system VapC family toxin [uncultured Jannaschia sp.]|uniref:type II toxin-antitoxin system VapC family toxin n=1 Tax=uncultured Jannaschia sp. TaxID=293347 RepID=UPI002608545A|nr:type II toxin-antitoxin system VapC family toxin [uncultured Jannaschia sp.]
MLDTNIVSELARNPQGRVTEHIAKVGPDSICVSIVVAAELRFGCAKKGSARLTAQIEAILESMPVLALDAPADAEYGRIRNELESAGTPIGPNDMLIAAHALASGAVVVTANIGEFDRVQGLRVENWID